MQTRTDWQIYGGNIASTLAGEFSFTIGLALALFGLGALAYTLDTRTTSGPITSPIVRARSG